MTTTKRQAAQLLGSLGGKARKEKTTPQQRTAQARKAANARWQKKEG